MSMAVTGSSATAVLHALEQVVRVETGESLEARLRSAGWDEGQPGSAGLLRRWQNGDLVVTQYGRGASAFIEATIDLSMPDLDDLDSEERLMKDFEERFATNLDACSAELGEPSFVGSYGDAGFPEELDAVMTARWLRRSGVIALHLKHEDDGVPFRITITAD
ncbi:hypothetical protein [Actinoplanes siamensis]|uniref:Uncharacterized protein n=1 Tax=Actinoplanes siamensis TaxID=1223317 RepID=A0A919NFV0_9ACTN|nr:hypothetical protein [Actinoplanes siamensis]GIF09905.1 hypothetical protein Asi03nite_74430 [Actinoplanes siamensis]